MNTPLGTIIIYARDMRRTAAFYRDHFGFTTTGEVFEGLIELHSANGGAGILIHQANGYQFANAKDPDENAISVSSRAYRACALSNPVTEI